MTKNLRNLEVIFCDDLREEVGNKLSYMGVYNGELNVPSSPVILPKLCILAKVYTDVDDPFESLEVRIYQVKDNEETEILSSGPINIPTNLPQQDGSSRFVVQMNFMLTPFQINEDFKLRVKAISEREEIYGTTALRIRSTSPIPPTKIH